MGHIKKQTIKGSVYSYIGVFLGFLISGLLLPRLLTTEENGILKLLISYSTLFAQFASFGFTNATTRLFAFFRDYKKNHHGFLLILFLVIGVGFILTLSLFLIFKNQLIAPNEGNAALFNQYINFLIPLSFFTLLFIMLDTYFKVLFDATIGTFYKEFIQRIFILIAIACFYFNVISLNGFIIAYIVANSLPGFILLVRLISTKQFSLKPDWGFIDKHMAKALFNMSFYGIVVGFAGIMVLSVDSIIISRMLGIEATGIYAITFFFSTLIVIPSRALRKISGTVLADAWRDNDNSTIYSVYRKSSINQLIFGALIFVGLWANINNVFKILPPEYEAGRYVILFLGLSNLIEMASGVSNTILVTSKYYRFTAWLNLLLVLMVVGFNILFIDIFGLTGAAIASVVSFLIFNLVRYLVIYRLFAMHPFSKKHLYTLLLAAFTYALSLLIPTLPNFIVDILVRSAFICIVFGGGTLFFNLSTEINETVKFLVDKITHRK
ncbi:MAG: oligosaccharide flippase family protein [Bacteroidales bacterium]